MGFPLGVDYSFARPDPTAIKEGGYEFVARYISPPPNGKNLTPDERDSILAAGLGLVLVWETYEQAASRTGYAGGQAEGARAIQMAQDLGYPAGRTIYFVLEDPRTIAPSLYPAAADYAQGVKDLNGPYVVGGYGSQGLMEFARQRGSIDMGWQVEGWSHAISTLCHLYQRSNGRNLHIPGVDDSATDEDQALAEDFGAWSTTSPQAGQPASPSPKEYETMNKLFQAEGTPAVWMCNGQTRWHIPNDARMADLVTLNNEHHAKFGEWWFDPDIRVVSADMLNSLPILFEGGIQSTVDLDNLKSQLLAAIPVAVAHQLGDLLKAAQ